MVSVDKFSAAWPNACNVPCTSARKTTRSSFISCSAIFSNRLSRDTLEAAASSTSRTFSWRADATDLAIFSSVSTTNSSPACGTPERPCISTGIDGPAASTCSPRSLFSMRTLPLYMPATKLSPGCSVPSWTRTVATGPRPLCSWASITIPLAFLVGSALNSKISACKRMDSSKLLIPIPFFAEVSQ